MADLKVSIVEPYWERRTALECQLGSLIRFYGDTDEIELVIVDDGSPTEPARPVVEEAREHAKFDIVLIENEVRRPDQGMDPCVPMNQAVRAARSDVVCLTQADIQHTINLVGPMLDQFRKLPPTSVMYPCCMDAMFPSADKWRCNQFTMLPTTDFTMIRKDFYLKTGGFDERFRGGYACSDTDFMRTLNKSGAMFVCMTNLLVIHRGDLCPQWRDESKGKAWFAMNQKLLFEKHGPEDEYVCHALPVVMDGKVQPIVMATKAVGTGFSIETGGFKMVGGVSDEAVSP